jgi:hypothetical protein
LAATQPSLEALGRWLYLRAEVGYFEDHLWLIPSLRGVTLLPYSASNDR